MRKSLVLRVAASSLILIAPIAQAAAPHEKSAARAEKLLAKKKLPRAVAEAEAAVAAAPRDAGYRMLLGRAYLESGRFHSAATSFADALALDPTRAAAALNLVLTRIATGDSAGAKTVIMSHGALIPAGDRGLALALAGDPGSGVRLLEEAVRNGLADPKTRQNLALSYALAGRWAEAKLMASYDLDPATLSTRIMEWSRFTREVQSSAQVALLLGVQPSDDAGQPVRLALNMPDVRLAEAPPPPPERMSDVAVLVQPISSAAAVPAEPPMPTPVILSTGPTISFAPRAEIVQRTRAPAPVQAVAKPAIVPVFTKPSGGRFVVQIGAYDSAAIAESAWNRTVTRIPALRGHAPSTATVLRGSATFHRLSVGGFGTRATAAGFCEGLRARGGQCFVRESAGDAPLIWAGRTSGAKFAAR